MGLPPESLSVFTAMAPNQGVPVAYWAQRFAASLIADLPAMGTFPIAFGAVTMIAIALVAAYVPAGRAGRIAPMEALRHE